MVKSIQQIPLQGKKVLVRVDYNVPLSKEGAVLDTTRIEATLPTLRYLLDQGCAVILMSHLGRPKAVSPEFSLQPIAKQLEKLIGLPVGMAQDCVGKEVTQMAQNLKAKEILLLENLRFHEAEEKPEKDPQFAKELASLGEVYVNDAFGALHRAHTSVVDVPKLFAGKAAAGFLLEKELKFLGQALKDPQRPFLALIGGAKISTKIGVLESLAKQVDSLAIGGGMAFTFLKAQGYEVGDSLLEIPFLPAAEKIIAVCQKRKIALLLPIDLVIAKNSKATQTALCTVSEGVPQGYQGLDIGPETIRLFENAIHKAKTILWNGPMGVFEEKPFAQGTLAIANSFAKSQAVTIAGGGETVAALQSSPFKEQVSHISTGGGATLEYLEFGTLPGIEALQ